MVYRAGFDRSHPFSHVPGVIVRGIPGQFWLDRHHYVQSFAARRLGAGLKPIIGEYVAESKGSFDHEIPIDPLPVAPHGWTSTTSHLHQPEQPIEVIDPNPDTLFMAAAGSWEIGTRTTPRVHNSRARSRGL